MIINIDFACFYALTYHFNVKVALNMSLDLTSQLINYYNYKNGIKPSYLKVLETMSGLISPKSMRMTK